MKRQLGFGALLLATVFWGASFFLIKMATKEVGVWPFLWWRFALVVGFFFILMPKKHFNVSQQLRSEGLRLGVLLFMIIWTQFEGLQNTTASRAGFITSLYVPLLPVIGWLLFRQKITMRQVGVTFIAFFGLYFLTQKEPFQIFRENFILNTNRGDLWTLAAAIFCVLHIFATEHYTRRHKDSLALGIWQYLFCFAAICMIVPLVGVYSTDVWNVLVWPKHIIVALLLVAFGSTAFGFTMQIVGQKTVGSLKAALIFALEAPFAALFAAMFLSERFTLYEAFGAFLVFVTSVIPENWLKRS